MKIIDAKIKETIKMTVLNKAKNNSTKNNIYLYTKVLTNDADVGAFYNSPKLTKSLSDIPQVLVLIDKHPKLNWSHECEYKMFNGDTGEYIETIPAKMPPVSFFLNNEDYEAIGPLVKLESVLKGNNIKLNPIQETADLFKNITGKKYAILFSGLSNNRHLNDMEYLYRVLIDIYKFDSNNITVLNYDGKANYSGGPKPVNLWPGDNTPYRIKVNDQGTKAAFINALNNYKSKLTNDDLLFIHSNNHGTGPEEEGGDEPCAICCHDANLLTAIEFGEELATFPQFNTLVVMMEQCYSGGFSEPTIKNSKAKQTVFSAACLPWTESMGGKDFDPYAYQWIKKISESNQITVHDAYIYATEYGDSSDTPNEADTPKDCGKGITL